MAAHSDAFDVVIIGAGPAGAAAAITLSRAGRRVLLVERHEFPREKACGGCLSHAAVSRLRSLLGSDVALPGVAGTRIRVIVGRHRLEYAPRGSTWITPRSELDVCMADAASAAGAEIVFGRTAALELRDDRWSVVVASEVVRAGTVLVASGVAGLSRKLGIEGRRVGIAMVSQQWTQPWDSRLPGTGEVELHWLRGGYVGIATPRAGETVVALAADASARDGRNPFERLRAMNPKAAVFAALAADAPKRYGACGSAGFPWLPARLGDRNALLIGDAAGYAEPFSGEGIGQALCSAACVSQAILEGGAELPRYTELMEREHRGVYIRTRAISAVLRSRPIRFIAERTPILPLGLLSQIVGHVHAGGGKPQTLPAA